jgi:hypothetical protein
MSGKSSRDRGAKFERTVAEILRKAGVADTKRGLAQARNAGEAADITGLEELGWWPELGYGGCTPASKLAQARDVVAGVQREAKPCARCGGTGKHPISAGELGACSTCKGTGRRRGQLQRVTPKLGLRPVAITRSRGGPVLVTMDLDTWVGLLLRLRSQPKDGVK